MKLIKPIAFFLLIVTLGMEVQAQGCSDAGICTLDNHKPGNKAWHETRFNRLSVGAGFGKADHNITAGAFTLDYIKQIDRLSFGVKLTSLSQSGNEASVFGLSDVYLTTNYSIKENLRATLGVKVPLNKANKKMNSLPLPMDYQSSLGTVDLLLGLHYEIGKLQLVVAYQQPLSTNGNSFLVVDYPAGSEFSKFQSTNNFLRRGDLMLRVSYPIALSEKISLTPSALPIYHLANDSFTDLAGVEQEITGSQGLTLNANIYLDYSIGSASTLQLNFGSPLVIREARPDGLTRHFVLNLEYSINF